MVDNSTFKGGGDIYIYNEASGAVIMSNSIPVADLEGGEVWENRELRCAVVESKVTSQQKPESLTLQLQANMILLSAID